MKFAAFPIVGAFALSAATAAMGASTAQSAPLTLPHSTAIPVRFEHSIDAKHAKAGDKVTARTMQVIALPDGNSIPKGAALTGHVATIAGYRFDTTPYAHQQPSSLSIHFDKLETGNAEIPVNLSVRAIASTIDSTEASYPHGADETDHPGMITLIGGMTFSPLGKTILSEDGDAIAYNRKGGTFARLAASGACEATETEQSIAIFSPNACGAYGLGGGYLQSSGRDGSGTFTLALRGHSMKLYAGTTALLETTPAAPETKQ